MLFKDERRLYHLGPSVGLMVDAFQRQNSPPEYLLAPLRRLAEDVGETTYLSTADGLDVVVVASVEGNHGGARPRPARGLSRLRCTHAARAS